MATLRANGPELLRIYRERDLNEKDVTWQRTTQVYFESGAILVKSDARFRPVQSWDPPNGRFYSWGWKKVTNAKDNPNPLVTAANMARKAAEQGWTIEFKSSKLDAREADFTGGNT